MRTTLADRRVLASFSGIFSSVCRGGGAIFSVGFSMGLRKFMGDKMFIGESKAYCRRFSEEKSAKIDSCNKRGFEECVTARMTIYQPTLLARGEH